MRRELEAMRRELAAMREQLQRLQVHPAPDSSDLVTSAEAAALLRVTLPTVYRYLQTGLLQKANARGRRAWIHRADVVKLKTGASRK